MRQVLALQHQTCETPGTIADALQAENISIEYMRSFEGQSVPKEMADTAGLVVMGGPMGVYESAQYPFLRAEMSLIEDALRKEKPILGVCLGSQLLASVLGAPVTPGKQKEIGWFPITLTDAARRDVLWGGIDSPFIAYHWHGDKFDTPRGAVSLASSELTECQAFRYGTNAYGFLFHMEVTETIIGEMVATFADELARFAKSGHEIVEHSRTNLPRLQSIGAIVFQRWASLIHKEKS